MKKISIILLLLFLSITNLLNAQEGWKDLFNGKDLSGWKQLNGQAKYTVENGEIIGTTVYGTPNSFLCTEQTYKDFILELELLVDEQMNSGIQFRSESKADYMNGRVHGYQCEVDPSERAWSGGIYDEARRGWLYTGTYNPEGQKAFKHGEWNKYRIECVGNNIRTWINGVPIAHLIDEMTYEGFISLQVHSIGKKEEEGRQIRWKNIRIKTENIEPTLSNDVFVVNMLPNNLSEAEKEGGWKLLFDGKTSKGWKSVSGDKFPEKGWEVKDGILSVLSSENDSSLKGGDIHTIEKYSAFDLQFEFNLTKGANSGVKYFTLEDKPSIGLEYQVLDDDNHPDALNGVVGNRKMASLYDLIPSETNSRFVKKTGEWNRGRIVVFPDGKIQHWLNGVLVVEYQKDSNIFRALVARSKNAKYPDFASSKEFRILLQDHNNTVHFRSIKIKTMN